MAFKKPPATGRLFFLFQTDSASGFLPQIAQEDATPSQAAAWGSRRLWTLPSAEASPAEPSWWVGQPREPERELWPGAWFEPWPWPLAAEPETLGYAGTSIFPKRGVSGVGKSIELGAWLPFGILGLNPLDLRGP